MEEELKAAAPPAFYFQRFQLSDADDVMEWMGDALIGEYTSWETVTTREEALEYLRTTVLPHPWYRAVCVDGKPVGFISVKPQAGGGMCRGEMSGSLAHKYWGRGIATAALKAAAAAAFRELPQLERLDALVAAENRASQRTLERAGFTREVVHRKYGVMKGKVRDAVRYCRLRTTSKL